MEQDQARDIGIIKTKNKIIALIAILMLSPIAFLVTYIVLNMSQKVHSCHVECKTPDGKSKKYDSDDPCGLTNMSVLMNGATIYDYLDGKGNELSSGKDGDCVLTQTWRDLKTGKQYSSSMKVP